LEASDFSSRIEILECSNISSAIHLLSSTPVHVLLLDKHLGADLEDPKTNGIEHIPEFLSIQPHLQVLVITGSNTKDDIVRAMKYGAQNYVLKEEQNELVLQHIEKLISVAKLKIDQARKERGQNGGTIEFVHEARSSSRLLHQIEAVAETSLPVLLLGETGTGKTTLANYIHLYRKRFLKQEERAFYAVNVSAISPTLVEAELFGYEKGAFTGAVRTKQGFFELANRGTLFLDEIGEISLETQKKLLTVLEDGTFYRLGSPRLLHSSFKLICATNQDLEALVKAKKFREDLYMRISTFTLRVPSISERKEDVPGILQTLLPRCCEENGVSVTFEELPKDFIRSLADNPPPGNIRGLKQQLSRLLIFCPRDNKCRPILSKWATVAGLPSDGARPIHHKEPLTLETLKRARLNVLNSSFPGRDTFMRLVEDKLFEEAKEKYKKNTQIAKALQISDTTVSNYLRRKASNGPEEGSLDSTERGMP
jgi:two-component system NtrC family response regulator